MRPIPLLVTLAFAAFASSAIASAEKPVLQNVGVAAGAPGAAAPQVVLDPHSTPAVGMNLADALTLERKASLWWDYARDVASVTIRLTTKGATTLLVPIDRAILALPYKPHNGPNGASDTESAALAEAFVAAHIVPGPLNAGEERETLHKGTSVRIEEKDGKLFVQPGDIEIVGDKEASNGKIYYIDGVVDYA